ncbi:transcription elongation factor GreAB [Methylovorus sp. MM2]|uniref:GreA/GreB family elongation factor n=1 Tax=Methylovorus sp. MM2 TaxID=1848038 RepID=UPI0007DE9A25|nr:GreA/GreB family elongation factor [Methylovorus sp. MM2]OAM52771.1 transcription elongation factor GreAB [Methylovorus sp. MM2]
MSRGFVKEDDLEHAGTDLPERPLSEHPNYVTPTGLKQLQEKADALEQERLLLAQRKEDPVAQQKLVMVERDSRYYLARLENAIIVEPTNQSKEKVLFGAKVTAEDEEGETLAFSIVGEDEADIAANKVSWVSPLAKALLGQKTGDSVLWHRPAGDITLEIISIEYE